MARKTVPYLAALLVGLLLGAASAVAQAQSLAPPETAQKIREKLDQFLPPLLPGGGAAEEPDSIPSLHGCDMGELRAFLCEKLRQNTDADPDSLSRLFLEEFYGPAESQIDYYLRLRRKSFQYSSVDLSKVRSPLAHAEGMLSPRMVARYNELFDAAEDAVHRDSLLLGRVRRARLPLQLCELELARHNGEVGRRNDVALALFEQRCAELGISRTGLSGASVADYCGLYRRRQGVPSPANLSLGKAVRLETGWKGVATPFRRPEAAITDGIFGSTEPDERWVGWEGRDGELTIDLGEVKGVRTATGSFLHNPGKRVLAPLRVGFFTSEDGKRYTHWTTLDIAAGEDGKPCCIPVEARTKKPLAARYVRIRITGTLECPDGAASWTLIDEITIL